MGSVLNVGLPFVTPKMPHLVISQSFMKCEIFEKGTKFRFLTWGIMRVHGEHQTGFYAVVCCGWRKSMEDIVLL